ncbi:MAG: anti-sigma factor antagonist, partial [Ruminiclostridium sp.]|nr:anti-sigma factor antagonist [Ruminiclostridium sp.]
MRTTMITTMRTTAENNTLTVFLEGRIDTNNAAQAESELFAAAEGANGADIVIDAEKLEYISSAGLRVLMKLRKSINKPLPVINVSRDVYDIFETTGFTELLDVKKALRRVSTDGMKLIGSGFTGDVYRMDDETVIKVFHKNISYDIMISKENQKARNAFLAGVPTAIPYDIVRVGECYGTVYEMLDAKDLVTVAAEDKTRLDEQIAKFARIVKNMHTIRADPSKFEPVKQTSLGALQYLASVLTDEEMKKVRALYESIPDRDTFIHGDCHLGNVMVRDGEMMFIDLGTSGTGHPIFDMG